ncbi:MAG: hypothetical protein AB7N71_14465 [Phycisphaerae bacterium]
MKPRKGESKPPPRWAPTVLGLACLLVTFLAARQVAITWFETPIGRGMRLKGDKFQRAITAARLTSDPTRRAALTILGNSRDLLRAHMTRQAHSTVRQRNLESATETGSAIGWLQFLAWDLQAMELAGMPLPERAARIQPYTEKLRSGDYSHHAASLIDAVTNAYESIGVPRGLAHQLAIEYCGTANYSFLQIFVPQSCALIDNLRETNPDAGRAFADAIRTLLTTWLCEPGPPALRLLCADLFVRHADTLLSSADDAANRDALQENIAALRREYHTHHADTPVTSYPLSATNHRVNYDPIAHRAACSSLIVMNVIFLITLIWSAVGVVVCILWAWKRWEISAIDIVGPAVVIAIVAVGVAMFNFRGEIAIREVDSFSVQTFAIPAHLLVATFGAVIMPIAAALITMRKPLLRRAGLICVFATLSLGIATIVYAIRADRALHRYDRAIAAAVEAELRNPFLDKPELLENVCAALVERF